jgi:arginyl-tRNA synthetase
MVATVSSITNPLIDWKEVFLELEKQVISRVFSAIQDRFGVEMSVVAEQPRQAEFGDMSIPAAFQLAKQLRKAPRVVAEELAPYLRSLPGIAAVDVAGNGYLNLRFDRAACLNKLLQPEASAAAVTEKTVVEHTNINPNKAAHIGHLRNAILGDTFVRMLRATGRQVEIQNYIDNTGVQVADVVVAFHFLEKKSLAEVKALTLQPRFDYLCWDVYARISSHYDQSEEARAWRAEALHAIEAGDNEIAEMGHIVADAIVGCHLRTMARLDITYDVLPRESEILHLKFWARCFELLKAKQAIYLESEGKNAGCWVMPGSAFRSDGNEEENKVIVRSNGIVTYVGKDIAYQLWKFGLLGQDFYYTEWKNAPGGKPLYVSSSAADTDAGVRFGSAARVYNVIDTRQSYLQEVVAAGLRALGHAKEAENSIHFNYEMVALSPRTCAELGIALSDEDKQRPYVEVSGRKGLGVKADDLIDKLIEKAAVEVDSRHAEAPAEERRAVAEIIAIGALRYFMLKFTRNTVIAFDLQEALSFEGETGPYVQYAAVRAANILRKLEERGVTIAGAMPTLNVAGAGTVLASDDALWQLLTLVSRLDQQLERAAAAGEPATLARYAFQLAQSFSTFYHDYPVISEAEEEKRNLLIWMTSYYRAQLTRVLHLLGMQAPVYM